ncbi:MAG TPA: NAD(P)H-hydrate dehydratase [Bacilli bacterium]|nr:NAD(P)H-hydrate dehydratase [Bacilli bacterium]
MLKKLARKHLGKIRHRKSETNKYDYGNVFIFGGSVGYFGAPLLSAKAAYRCGSGLVHILVPNDLYEKFPQTFPEVMVHPYHKIDDVGALLYKMDAVLFGPGLNPYDSRQLEILNLLLSLKKPLVIDASGLDFLKQILPVLDDGSFIVATPHTGEAERLLDTDKPERHLDMLFDKKMTVVLKDSEVLIAQRHHSFIAINGNPGMATAGTGDVLAGMILSYLGQGYKPLEACKMAVFLHQKAASLAEDKYGEDSMMASDIIESLPDAIKSIK